MLFNSLEFLIFFTVVYTAYLISSHRTQNILLVVSSYVFYGAWDYRFLALIFASTVIDYCTGLAIYSSSVEKTRKFFLLVSIWANLGILGFFKYFDFFIDSFEQLGERVGLDTSLPHWDIILPVGISFYTFQTMSYTIDVYRGTIIPTKKMLDFALFVSFFPQLVAGPIERAKSLLPQILAPRRVTLDGFYEGCYLILWGLFLKVYVADNLAGIAAPIFTNSAVPGGSETIVACLAFPFQIYGDFAGYSCMAKGIAKCMGFDLMINFNLPFLAGNPAEFWRRWHISLFSWMRDYVYISAGGNRFGGLITYRNLMLTMVLSGLWHGAGWNFIAWGFYHGLLLSGHRLIEPLLRRYTPEKSTMMGRVYRVVTIFIFFGLLGLGWPIFLSSTLEQAYHSILGIWMPTAFTGLIEFKSELLTIVRIAGPLMIIEAICYCKNDLMYFYKAHWVVRSVFYYYLLVCIILFGSYGKFDFFYFQF